MDAGKRWETNFKNSLPSIIRLYDTTNGFAGIKNPCDFVYYVYPYNYMVELKSVKGVRFDFNLLTDHQLEQLDYYDTMYGVTSLVCVEFREIKTCVAIPFKIIKKLRSEDKKSINYKNNEAMLAKFKIPTKYAVVNCRIQESQFKVLLRSISEMGGEYEITD